MDSEIAAGGCGAIIENQIKSGLEVVVKKCEAPRLKADFELVINGWEFSVQVDGITMPLALVRWLVAWVEEKNKKIITVYRKHKSWGYPLVTAKEI